MVVVGVGVGVGVGGRERGWEWEWEWVGVDVRWRRDDNKRRGWAASHSRQRHHTHPRHHSSSPLRMTIGIRLHSDRRTGTSCTYIQDMHVVGLYQLACGSAASFLTRKEFAKKM